MRSHVTGTNMVSALLLEDLDWPPSKISSIVLAALCPPLIELIMRCSLTPHKSSQPRAQPTHSTNLSSPGYLRIPLERIPPAGPQHHDAATPPPLLT